MNTKCEHRTERPARKAALYFCLLLFAFCFLISLFARGRSHPAPAGAPLVPLPSAFGLLPSLLPDPAAGSAEISRPYGAIIDNPGISISGATADTASTSTTGASLAHVSWVFGTVAGTYNSCTVQAKTSYDGTTWVTLGSAAAVTVTSSKVNVWDIYQQAASSTAVTVTGVSATAATGFGLLTKYTFACSTYGTSAPVTVSVTYR